MKRDPGSSDRNRRYENKSGKNRDKVLKRKSTDDRHSSYSNKRYETDDKKQQGSRNTGKESERKNKIGNNKYNSKGKSTDLNNIATTLFSMSNKPGKYFEKVEYKNYDDLITFVADSGATEHLTKSKLFLKAYNEKEKYLIRCANKESSADMRTEGVGNLSGINNNKLISMQNVIYTKSLSENLLSLRKFVDMGMCVYLDNEKINIYNPYTRKMLL